MQKPIEISNSMRYNIDVPGKRVQKIEPYKIA